MSTYIDEFRLILHLCSWAQLGVLTRAYLEQVFGGACNPNSHKWKWIPCVTSPGLTRYGGVAFTSTPSNIVGSFIMGILSASDILAAVFRNPSYKGIPMAILPKTSSLQTYTPFLMGLRTGYCGSLTTLSSWILQMVMMMIGNKPSTLGTEWFTALCGTVTGTMLALASLAAGQQLSLFIFSRLNPQVFHPDLELASAKTGPQTAEVSTTAADPKQTSMTPSIPLPPTSSALYEWWSTSPSLPLLTDVFAALNLLVLTGVSIGMLAHDPDHSLSFLWFSILLGPFGCLLRWKLARFNGALPGSASWFPMGTFAANILACGLDFVVQLILLHVSGMSLLKKAVLRGVILGVGGCLSTVSTWVVEVQKLNLNIPLDGRGYQYMFITIVASGALGILIYGSAVWTL